MKTRIIIQLVALLVLLLGTSTEGLFFSYPKNAIVDFFHSLHHKKEVKKHHAIHHYHLHYYPVRTQIWAKPIKAPAKIEIEALHSNHLEALGWGEPEYNFVPESAIYRTSPPQDVWPESSVNRPWEEQLPEPRSKSVEQRPEAPNSGIIVQVPLHQNIVVQPPKPKEEKPETHPLVTFFQNLRRIKNSIFSDRSDSDETNARKPKTSVNDKLKAYVVYFKPEAGRKL